MSSTILFCNGVPVNSILRFDFDEQLKRISKFKHL